MMNIKMAFGRPSVPARHPWPDTIDLIQGGDDGVVLSNKPEGNYRTAFVEVFSKETGFLRGEGATVEEAEDNCWTQAQKAWGCPGHEYEARGYKNGGGICKHCGRFKSQAFTAEELGLFCPACGVATFWHIENRDPVGEFTTCPEHTPHRESSFCFCPPCKVKWDREREEFDISEALTALLGDDDG